jgi:hypothetical protein
LAPRPPTTATRTPSLSSSSSPHVDGVAAPPCGAMGRHGGGGSRSRGAHPVFRGRTCGGGVAVGRQSQPRGSSAAAVRGVPPDYMRTREAQD